MQLSPAARTIADLLPQLSAAEQTWLLEHLAQQIRRTLTPTADWSSALVEMAADADIQAELATIESEFAIAELDGLA